MGQKGVKTWVKIDFSYNISKSLHLFFQIFYMLIEVNSALLLAKTAYLAKIWQKSDKSGQNGVRMEVFDYISKSLHLIFQIFFSIRSFKTGVEISPFRTLQFKFKIQIHFKFLRLSHLLQQVTVFSTLELQNFKIFLRI